MNHARCVADDWRDRPQRVGDLERGLALDQSNGPAGLLLTAAKAIADTAAKPVRRDDNDVLDPGELQSIEHVLDDRSIRDLLHRFASGASVLASRTNAIVGDDHAEWVHTRETADTTRDSRGLRRVAPTRPAWRGRKPRQEATAGTVASRAGCGYSTAGAAVTCADSATVGA